MSFPARAIAAAPSRPPRLLGGDGNEWKAMAIMSTQSEVRQPLTPEEIAGILAEEERLYRWCQARERVRVRSIRHRERDRLDESIWTLGKLETIPADEAAWLAKHIQAGLTAASTLAEGGVEGEEADRLERIADMGDAAREQMTFANIPLVIMMMRKHGRGGLGFADALQAGITGILRAVDLFDPSKGMFSTYAAWWIRREIDEAKAKEDGVITLTHGSYNTVRALNYLRVNSDMTQEEIADALGIPVKNLAHWEMIASPTSSLDSYVPGPEEARDTTLGELIVDESVAEPCAEMAFNDLRRDLDRLVGRLTAKERHIITKHYGLDGEKPQTFRELSAELGLTPGTVKEYSRGALKKLRNDPECYKLQVHLLQLD